MNKRCQLLFVAVLFLLGSSGGLQGDPTVTHSESGSGEANFPLVDGAPKQAVDQVSDLLDKANYAIPAASINIDPNTHNQYTNSQAKQEAIKLAKGAASKAIGVIFNAFEGVDVEGKGLYQWTTDYSTGTWSQPEMKTRHALHVLKGKFKAEASAILKGEIEIEVEIELEFEYDSKRFSGSTTGPSATVTADVSRNIKSTVSITAGAPVQITGGVGTVDAKDLGDRSVNIKVKKKE